MEKLFYTLIKILLLLFMNFLLLLSVWVNML